MSRLDALHQPNCNVIFKCPVETRLLLIYQVLFDLHIPCELKAIWKLNLDLETQH